MTTEFYKALMDFFATLAPLQCAECLRPIDVTEATPVPVVLSAAGPPPPNGKRYAAEIVISLRCPACLACAKHTEPYKGELPLPESI